MSVGAPPPAPAPPALEGALRRAAWLPIPILLALLLTLAAEGNRSAFQAPLLAAGLAFATRTLATLLIMFLAGRSFLARGELSLLLLSCGVALWGTGNLLYSTPLLTTDGNLALTVNNLAALLAGGCHLAGAGLALRPGPPRARRPVVWWGAGHGLALGLLGLLAWAGHARALPPFFIQGQAGTWHRQLVLGAAMALFLAAAFLVRRLRKRASGPFYAWYCWALVLIATGLFGALLQHGRYDLLGWTSRAAQSLGGIYLLAAAVAAVQARGTWNLPLQEALRHTEAALSGVLNASRESIWLFDPAGVVLLANETALKRMGRTAAEVIGHSFLEFVPAELGRSRLACLQEVVRSRAPVEALDERAGMVFQHTFYPVFDGHGRVAQIAAFSSDITERKRTERAMAEALAQAEAGQRLLAALMEHVPEGITVTDAPAGTILRSSRYGQELLGRAWNPALPVPSAKGLEIFQPDGVTPMAAQEVPLARALAGATLKNVEVVQGTEDGRRVPLLCNAAPIRDGQGTIVGAIVVWREISELKRTQEALRASERLYRAIGEAIHYGVWVCAPDGRNTYASPSFLELVGLTQEQCSNFGWGEVLHPEDAERTIAAWKRCVQTGGPWDIEHRFRGVDGRWHPILARGIAVRDERGEITHWAGINLDIQRMKDAEDALKRTVAELERSNRELEQFAYICSHDLQEPLRQVLVYSDRLRGELGERLEDRAARHLAFVEEGAARTRDLIRGLLDYARAGAPGPGLATCGCAGALAAALDNLRVSIQESGAVITCDPLPVVQIPEREAVQLFQNLLGNALKFRREGTRPRIHVGHGQEGGLEHLWVRDDGIGIDPRFHGKVFQIFQRLHDRERFPGTGIGLAICKKIVEQHGGSLWFKSRIDAGATFHFTLKAAAQALPPP
jgi:PAS domain S-box-containing protein